MNHEHPDAICDTCENLGYLIDESCNQSDEHNIKCPGKMIPLG